ncbi:hypothetical protein RJ55_06777 [Drechmeria coniospora]|nr:hypothetical protein RJ55_06777 [Drechmeria coniospora]
MRTYVLRTVHSRGHQAPVQRKEKRSGVDGSSSAKGAPRLLPESKLFEDMGHWHWHAGTEPLSPSSAAEACLRNRSAGANVAKDEDVLAHAAPAPYCTYCNPYSLYSVQVRTIMPSTWRKAELAHSTYSMYLAACTYWFANVHGVHSVQAVPSAARRGYHASEGASLALSPLPLRLTMLSVQDSHPTQDSLLLWFIGKGGHEAYHNGHEKR